MIPTDEHNALKATLVATGRGIVLVLAGALLMLAYGTFQFNGLNQPSAMDQAQIGRNLARGEGFTTYFIRPLSLWQTAQRQAEGPSALLRHPDIIHPPLYPALLGSLFAIVGKDSLSPKGEPPLATSAAPPSFFHRLSAKLIGWRHWSKIWFMAAAAWGLWLALRTARFAISPAYVPRHAAGVLVCGLIGGLFWAQSTPFEVGPPRAFTVFGPDRWIAYGVGIPLALLNCALLYAIARRLFDRRVALTAACLFGLAETTIQFALSGLSTMLTMAWINAAWLLLIMASDLRDTGTRPRGAVALALAASVAMAGAFLTHYAAGWLLLPLCLMAWRTWGLARGAAMAAAMSGMFLALITPWLARNYALSGKFLGLAGYAMSEHTLITPGSSFQRLMDPAGVAVSAKLLWFKAVANASAIWTDSGWLSSYGVIAALFVAVLLYRFRRSLANRLKWCVAASGVLLFIVWCLAGLVTRPEKSVAQADNLLVFLIPLASVFSTAVFYAHLENLKIVFKSVRIAAIALLVLLTAFPLLARLAGPPAGRLAYPPYHPPLVSHVAGYVEPDEFIVSDQPWAVAWYGNRRCFWIPYSPSQFLTINDMHHRIAGFLLTPVTLNNRLLTEVLSNEWAPWSSILGFLDFPKDFPLRYGRMFVGPEKRPVDWKLQGPVSLAELSEGVHMIVLCDIERWKRRLAPAAQPKRPSPPAGAKTP